MKAYLTMLRRDGKRLEPDQLTQPPRLVSLTLSAKQGFRYLKAVCCFGGSTLGELWEPTLSRLGNAEFTLHGFERNGEAGLVQEWKLTLHVVASLSGGNR